MITPGYIPSRSDMSVDEIITAALRNTKRRRTSHPLQQGLAKLAPMATVGSA